MIFKDFHECKMVFLEWRKEFKYKYWKKIKMAIIHADESTVEDRKKCWLVQNAILNALWENDEATSVGYTQWIKNKRRETLDMIEYYRKNPDKEEE
jgi:hypothetical protein